MASKTANKLTGDVQRLWDLVRFCRGDLFDADLITEDEYAALLSEHPGAVARLETYDELRAENQRLRKQFGSA